MTLYVKYGFFTILFFINISFCLSQEVRPSLGVIVQDRFFADFTLNVGQSTDGGPDFSGNSSDIDIASVAGFAGFETDFIETYAPKVGVEVSLLILTGRFSVISYFQKGDVTIRALPEIGLGIINKFNVSYGYGFSPHKNNLENVSNHRLKLTFFL